MQPEASDRGGWDQWFGDGLERYNRGEDSGGMEAAEDMFEGETALARWAHATTHADKSLRLHRRATSVTSGGSLAVEVESVTGTSSGHVLVVA